MDFPKPELMDYSSQKIEQGGLSDENLKTSLKLKLQLNGDSDSCSNVTDNDNNDIKVEVNGNYDSKDSKDSNSPTPPSETNENDTSEDEEDKKEEDKKKSGEESDDSDESDNPTSRADQKKQYMIFSDDEEDLDNYECGQSSADSVVKDRCVSVTVRVSDNSITSTDYEVSGEEKSDDDDDNYSSENSEEEVYQKKKRSSKKKNRLWEGNEEMYGIRRSGRDRKSNQKYHGMEDSDEPEESGDDSSAFFKQKPKRKTNRSYKNLSESEESVNSDYSPSEERRGSSKKKKKFKRIKKLPPSPKPTFFREIRTRKKEVNYRDVEETDPLGSEDEADKIYIEEPEQEPEELSEKIEKVMHHRIGPKWQVGDMTAPSAGGKGLKCLEDAPEGKEARCPQYFIKWARYSHIHNTWESDVSLEEKGCKGLKILENYQKKQQEVAEWKKNMSPEDLEYYDVHDEMKLNLISQYTDVDRIITHSATKDEEENTSIDYLVKWRSLPYSDATYEKDSYLKEHHAEKIKHYERMKNSDTKPNTQYKSLAQRCRFVKHDEHPSWIPEGLKLRDYQLDGLNWLGHSWCKRNSVILADEMGLGKTIQTVCFLNYVFYSAKQYGPFLLVVPLSTMPAWEREFAKWAPNMNTIMYIGDMKSRQTIQENEWTMPSGKLKFNAIVTSYEIVLKDIDFFQSYPWAVLAVDEAHRLKNDQSSLYKVLINLRTFHRLLITGTPLQNSLKELWALLHFIMPTNYPSFEEFESIHGEMSEMNGESLSKIHKELEPYLLRRVKKDVEKSLPGKTEQILRVDMTVKQKQYYRWILTRNFSALSKEKGSNQSLMNIMMELKKCCNHCELTVPLEAGHTDLYRLQSIVKGSGKLWLLDKLLARCKERGNRVLIFSQMVRQLDIIAEYLELKKFGHQRLDGGVKGDMRAQALDHFNAEGSTDFCFLLSTRAGGLGINLATADTVIIFDSDWNPQNDLQAMARAHRIGQKKQVNIYRLVTKNSVEEDIIERAKKKMILDHLVIQKMDTSGRMVLHKNNPNKNIPFNKEELTAVLKFGAVELFKDDSNTDQHLEGLDLDTVLKEAETRVQEEEAGAGHELLSQFKVANFTVTEEEAPGPGWDTIIPKDQIEAIQLAEKAENEVPLYIPPRRGKKVNYTGNVVSRRNHSDSEGEKHHPKSKRRKMDPPAHKKRRSHSQEEFDEAEVFSKSEIRKFIKSFRKFGPAAKRLKEIGRDAGLSASLPELDALLDILHTKISEAEAYATNIDGTQKKNTTILLGGCSFSTNQITQRETMLNNLEYIPEKPKDRIAWRIDKNTKPTGWDLEWGLEEDSMLLLGVYEHGLGSWDKVIADPKLNLAEKIFPADSEGKPRPEHLTTRAEYLLKNLPKLMTKSPTKAPKKKERKSRKKKKEEPEEDIREFFEENKPTKSRRKKRTKKEDQDEVEEIKQTEAPAECSDVVFKKCKEMMRPVRKTLRMLENPKDDADTEEQLRQTKSHLLTIGQQIEKTCEGKSDEWIKEWTENLWVFVSQFTPIGSKQLKKLYNKAVRQSSESQTKSSKKRKR
ncbi:chromodomain-helicase-DNA-binding protein 1-like isoform X2 [Bolinopsis microptera]|uniref:chromodomain-helicase-DNA-binding protein 1-like isoform X2 n=1 Tax=Bolinopsis microptera TaxID=2820187 RepID=UPI003078AFCA